MTVIYTDDCYSLAIIPSVLVDAVYYLMDQSNKWSNIRKLEDGKETKERFFLLGTHDTTKISCRFTFNSLFAHHNDLIDCFFDEQPVCK